VSGARLPAVRSSAEAVIETIAQVITIEEALEDPGAIRRLVDASGPYPSIASYLPPSATRGAPGATLPWFRGNWAVDGRPRVSGAEAILFNRGFLDAAADLLATPDVTPTTVVVNVNAPMPAGAIHLDIPSFRGAGRGEYPLPLLQAMGTSGLFEAWRVVEIAAITWFYDGPGGSYDYWPEGLDGPMHSARPPFDNVALVADNDRMFHRIGWVGDPDPPLPPLTPAAAIDRRDGGWSILEDGVVRAHHPDEQIRISVLWKARSDDHDAAGACEPLTPQRVVEAFAIDLVARGLGPSWTTDPFTDQRWLDLVHATYYPTISVDA